MMIRRKNLKIRYVLAPDLHLDRVIVDLLIVEDL